jgi:hypothetical protein
MLTPEILPSARKHGISDADMMHALRNPVGSFDLDEITMTIGASTSGHLLEIGYIPLTTQVLIIHAMSARGKFLRYL